MNVVMIIPTGLGCEIGGHAGDANPAAKLLGAVCDNLILHPNVVNASDINEMPGNALYVEGSILDKFLKDEYNLKKIHFNKILLAVNKPVSNQIVNAAGAARVTLGADIEIVEVDPPLIMKGFINESGAADGEIKGLSEFIDVVTKYDFDALAINTHINIDKEVALNYLNHGGVNPWGGVEAKLSKRVATILCKPTAHAPCGDTLPDYNEVVDLRMSAELISTCYIHCVLKGLHKAPRITSMVSSETVLNVRNIDFLISPYGCYGQPHAACEENDIPIIVVDNNKCAVFNNLFYEMKYIPVANYIEAAGVISCYKAGIDFKSVLRPLDVIKIN